MNMWLVHQKRTTLILMWTYQRNEPRTGDTNLEEVMVRIFAIRDREDSILLSAQRYFGIML